MDTAIFYHRIKGFRIVTIVLREFNVLSNLKKPHTMSASLDIVCFSMSTVHISISAEPLFHLGNVTVTNAMLTSVLVSCFLILLGLCAKGSLQSGKLSRFRMFMEFVIESLHNLVTGIVGTGKRAALFGPIIMTFFLFILLNNWIGLLPGVGSIGFTKREEIPAMYTESNHETPTSTESEHKEETGEFIPYFRAGTADLNMTLALAIISVGLTQIYGFSFQKFHYFSKFINFSNPINFFVGLLETVLEFAKIVSFAFRLFGNIFAGEVLLAVMTFLIPVVVPMPFYGLELFVGFIQALVFSMLSLVFFNMATIGHGEEH